MDYDAAKRQHDATMRTATQIMREDVLLRRIVEASVYAAIQDFGRVDPEHADRDAFDIAIKATAIAVARMMNEGDGLATLEAERDAYKAAALRFAAMTPPAPIILATPPPAPAAEPRTKQSPHP